jgi:hypothetical protein
VRRIWRNTEPWKRRREERERVEKKKKLLTINYNLDKSCIVVEKV